MLFIKVRLRRVLLVTAIGALAALSSCASAKKKTPELSRLEGKKVALIDVDGEATARKIVEVALINQLVKRGTFILVSKQDVEAARSAPKQDPTDWQGIARAAGADYGLDAKVLEFAATTHEGVSKVEVEDSQLAAERGEDSRKTERIYKVKALRGTVKVELTFAELDPKNPDIRKGIAEKTDEVTSEAKEEAAHLPPKLRFLEKITNEAFRDFFERYN